MNESPLSLEVALQQFEEIRMSLDVKKSLQWELSLSGLKSALHFVEHPQTQQFVEDYMLKQVNLMTSQNPGKLGTFERNTIDHSLEICLQILCHLLPSRPKLLIVLGKIFDPFLIYYNGSKIGYTYSPGFPHMRIINGKKFAEMRGFVLIHQVFQSEFWPGCDVLRPILKLVDDPEVAVLLDDHLRVEIARTVMAKLLSLSDEVAKKENTDILQEILRLLSSIWTSCTPKAASPLAVHQHMTGFHKFWMGYISKLIRSSSLVLKLFGWEQVNDLILDAKAKRADAASFQVTGAGTTVVNGIYTLNGKHSDTNSNRYVKAPSTPDEPFLTLFRCTMRTKAKWWFISIADLEKPGTDKDVDYYLHRSLPEDEREPPPFNWVHVNVGITLMGIDPCPVVRRHDIVIPPGMTKDMFLDAEVIAWCTKGDLLTEIFGNSIHREIISRSGKLLIFLAEYDILDAKFLSLLWKAVLTNNDNDIVDEILCQLVHLSPYLSGELFSYLISLASEELARPAVGAAGGEEQHQGVSKVAQFMEKFAKEGSKYITNGVLTPDAVSTVANWLWKLFCRPNFEQIKCSGAIQELLSICLHKKGSSFSVAREKILECKTKLAAAAEQHHNRLVNILYFLISKHCTFELAEQLTKEGLSACILSEIRRHVLENRASGSADYIGQLASRLNLLRRFVALTSQLTLESVEYLWQLLRGHPQEQDELFRFLKISSTGTYDTICSPEVAVQIFGSYICNPQVDWSTSGTAALECFHAYFSQIETHSEQVAALFTLPPTGGLDTLWRIVLSIRSVELGSDAIDWLIQAYDRQYNRGVTTACSDLLQRVFTHLTAVQTQNYERTEEDGALSPKSLLCIRRCVRVLHCAILRWKGVGGPSHIVRNCLSRINITILYRRVSPYYSHSVHSDVVRVDKGFEGSVTLEVHPYFTILQLKERLVRSVSIINDVTGINFDSTNHVLINDFTRVFELGVVDGGILHCSFQAMYTSHKGYDVNDSMASDYAEPVTPTTSSSTSVGSCVGQLLADNYSLFDCLLTLCELMKNPEDCKAVWDVLMLAPTQLDLMQQIKDQICVPSPADGASNGLNSNNTMNAELESCPSVTRKAYLLQIIDSFLQPAPELSNVETLEQSLAFKDAFISSGGFVAVLNILISTPTRDFVTNSTALAVALHIVHFLLYGDSAAPMVAALMDIDMDDSVEDGMAKLAIDTNLTTYNAKQTQELLHQIEKVSDQVIEKLLLIARYAADREESSVVQNALLIITNLIKAPEVASQLINNGESKTLLCRVLRSGSKRVREMAADFAIQVGKSQPVVFSWLVNELLNISAKDNVACSETFLAIADLLPESHIAESDVTLLAEIISEKLIAFTTTKESELAEEPNVLVGYMELLNVMLKRHTAAILETLLGQDLISIFMKHFLFALPPSGETTAAICVSPQSRQAAFNILASFVGLIPSAFEEVMEQLAILSEKAANHFSNLWSVQIAHEVRQRDLKFTGLKNQGCTCYMNSLLQLLFMSTTFREAILATPLPESIRSTMWHRQPQELVGQEVCFAWSNGSWRWGKVVDYIEEENLHTVEYYHADGTLDESATFNIHEGRFSRETGKVRLLGTSDELNERDEAAYRVLEQLQRTFCFLKHSNRRYFDPRPFVDACKTLNLNFNVYSQNDAAEFCDQLLDRVETATKGKHSKIDLWTDDLMRNVFGGKWLYQKIPRECEAYDTNKAECGHYQGSRLESFLKVELMIRGKEHIDESLAELVQGELMDGDNKISCDVCGEKKATVRRTCFGVLPNTLILHLKRFDLDFQTFETVKLNNKLSFPTKINLLKYTKEGIEAADKAQQEAQQQQQNQQNKNEDSEENTPEVKEGKKLTLEYEHSIDPSGDFEYELQGVLVHAGVAQGGHYYSFVRDETNPSEETSWYRFDDDVVSSFNPDNIPAQCFGGPQPSVSTSHMHSVIDEDRSSNALMLLYNKVKRAPTAPTPTHTHANAAANAVGSALITGTQAFEREVQESNLQHILSVYLIDPALHSFVRGMLDAIAPQKASAAAGVSDDVVTPFELNWSVEEADFELPLRLVQFYSEFMMNVVLHCRERTAMRSSVSVLIAVFERFPDTALWFVSHVLGDDCTWLQDYLMLCTDALARASFVQLLVQAVIVFAPKEPHALRKMLQNSTAVIKALPNQNAASLCALLVRSLIDSVVRSVNHIRTADEIFVAIRDLAAAVPCICNALQAAGCVAYLSFFVLPIEQVSVHVRAAFERHLIHIKQNSNSRSEYSHVMQSVFEAMAALLGVPQIRKVNLLQDRSYFVPELIIEAKEALTVIFVESSHNGCMDTTDAHAYFEKVNGMNAKMTGQQLRHFMDRYSNSLDGKLGLDGFLQYHTDNASLNPKLVWRDLHAFGFKNNLVRMMTASQQHRTSQHPQHHADDSFVSADSRVDSVVTDASAGGVDDSFVSTQPTGQLFITEQCRESLSKIALYESGLTASEASTKAIAMRCCTHSETVSVDLLIQALHRLHSTSLDQTWHYQHSSMVFDFIKLLIGINDELVIKRIHTVLINPDFGLASVAQQERLNPTKCRANDVMKWAVFDKYIGYVQDLIASPGVLDCINSLAANEPTAKFVRGFLKLHLNVHSLSENELANVRNTTVVVDGAGTREVNGEYHFIDVKNQGGYYERVGPYNGNPAARFTLYKCHLKNGGYQWFLSITPDDADPGTVQDMDFYYAPAKLTERTPPSVWLTMSTQCTRDPAPRVECLCENKTETSESSEKEDDEDEEDLCSSLAAGDDEPIDTSFFSHGSDVYMAD